MAKAATQTTTKAATKRATKADKEDKPKREPSAYNLFVKEHMKPYLDAHPGMKTKEAMPAIAEMWRNDPSNPNRGKAPAAKKAKTPVEGKENKKSKKSKKDAEEKEEIAASSD